MKLKNILSELGCDNTNSFRFGRSEVLKAINQNINSEIVAYDKSALGSLVIVKGKRIYFSFVILRKDIGSFGGYDYRTMRIKDMGKSIRLLENSNAKIINEELYEELQKKVVVEEL